MRFTTERALPASKVSLQVASNAKNFTLMSMWLRKCLSETQCGRWRQSVANGDYI